MSQPDAPTAAGARQGSLNVHTENIFPIIKRFLYQDQDVFLRELVSNAVDATQKLKTLSSVGTVTGELGELAIDVRIDREARTLTIQDRGIGMTEDEVERYINNIAFSSAEAFLEQYQGEAEPIIGHFGLGFYSAFMVAKTVELRTKSYQADAPAVRWRCDGTTQFELGPDDKADRGTEVILHLNDEADEYLQPHRIREILNRHARFLPVPVRFEDKAINDLEPLWTKAPSELKDEDYLGFYRALYPMEEDPIFWIHLNVDYPFTLTGVLYFPRLKPDVDLKRNRVHLYSNQVFITDEVRDIVPEYLTLLHGVIDSPDIPLNVSRSSLQTDANVRKITGHIAKKVADALKERFRDDRQAFEATWEAVGVFVKYGMMMDPKFRDQVGEVLLLADTEGTYYTQDELKAALAPNHTDKDNQVVALYTTDPTEQYATVAKAKAKGYTVLDMQGMLDVHFAAFLDQDLEGVTLKRVDADTLDRLIDKGIEHQGLLNEAETEDLKTLLKDYDDRVGEVHVQALGEDQPPLTLTRPEHLRRLHDMAKQGFFPAGELPKALELVVNGSHTLCKRLAMLPQGEERNLLARNLYDLALLEQGLLTGKSLTNYLERAQATLLKANA